MPAPQQLTDAERRRYALRLLEMKDFVNVWSPKDHDPDYDDTSYNLAVSYSDTAAAFEDLMMDSVALIEAFPGVIDVLHDDRELIRISGTLEPTLLQERLLAWWVERLRDIADG